MKKIILTALFVIIGSLAFAQERIAVFPFEDLDNIFAGNEFVMFYRRFSNEFTNKNNGRFRVVPRQDVDRLINTEAKFQLSDFSAREKTAEMERVLNGTRILSGVIAKNGTLITISISLYTYPDLEQLPGGVDLDVASKSELNTKIPVIVQMMMTAMTGGSGGTGGGNTGGRTQEQMPANFVRVEGGTFQMGGTMYDGEKPIHTVTVKTFSISKYQVTQREWYEVMGTTVRQQRDMADKSYSMYGEGDNYPMYYVNWYEVMDYCNKRSLKEGLTPAYRGSGDNITCDWNANGYRLPTEAEWEFAAKGGIKDYLTTEYSGSNSVDAVAWYAYNSGSSTHPVGTKTANSLGIHDMNGNVWEWCWDWYGNYSSGTQTDPRGAISGAGRVIRGGSWYSSAWDVRSAYRVYFIPSYRGNGFGFRLVRP